ncbi:hypothetical protein SDC9_124626 [bioreactor metagenome]|uniref:Uncharacterized protein n=1 Tax=bioreactor metagenome TaxID=1076179 RepID=A0A645CL18_9ZZZZ
MQRSCLGQENSETLIQSRFRWNAESNELQCAGTGDPQPIAHNVANFQVRYLVQPRSAPPGDPKIQYVNASAVSDWSEVTAVQVCIVLYGNEAISLPAGSTYKDCPSNDGTVADIDMTSLPAPRARRLHMSFRNIYQLRSQLAQP